MERSTPPAETHWYPERRPFGIADVIALAVWTAAVVFYFWDAVTLRKAFFYFDVTEINFAYRDFFARELKLGRFSRWCPQLYCGMALFSESQAGYLHPLKFVFYPWMATWKAFNLDNVASVWLTGLGTYGWLRRHVGPSGALTGAAVFGFSGFVWAHFIHTSMNNALTSVPLVIWATEWAWDRGRTAGIALAAMALACQVFAGHLQDVLFTAALIGLYSLFRAATEWNARARIQTLVTGGAVIALGVALASVQWIPSKELLDRSPRAGGLTWRDLTYGSWHPELLPALVVREAYGTRARDTDWMDGFYPYHEMNAYLGLTALALAVIGAAACRDRWVAFWIVLAGLASLLMLGKFTCLFDYAQRIPIAGSSRIPVRFHLWLSLAVAALAGVGVDRLNRGFPVKLRAPAILILVMVFGSIPILIYAYLPVLQGIGRSTIAYHIDRNHWLTEELKWAAARTALLGAGGWLTISFAAQSKSARRRALACMFLPMVVILDLLGSHWHEAPVIAPAYWTDPPETAKRLLRDSSVVRVYGIADRSAGEPGYASEPIDFFGVRDPLDWSLAPVWGLSSARGETPLIPLRLFAFNDNAMERGTRFDLQAITHLLSGRRVPLPLKEPVIAGTALIYKNTRTLPRFRLVGRPMYVKDATAALAALRSLGEQARERVVVEDPDQPFGQDVEADGSLKVVRDDPEEIEIETNSNGPAYLTIADTFDPGWSATLDGRPAPIRPAWVMFRAVALTAGHHRLKFAYRPAGFGLGLTISLIGLLPAVSLLIFSRPMGALRDAHDGLSWSASWPVKAMAAGLILIVGSAISISGNKGIGLSSRWESSFHQFTWGAGIDAMRQGIGKTIQAPNSLR